MAMFRRLKWGNIDSLQANIDQYFALCEQKGRIPNIAGLCVCLDISNDCWHYYSTDLWQTKRKSDDEIKAIQEQNENVVADETFEEYMEISEKVDLIYDEKSFNKDEEYRIKSQLSNTLKKAKQRIEAYVVDEIFNAKNPAGAIFYAKSALKYREMDVENGNSANSIPAKITITILPPPQKNVEATTINVLADKEQT